MAESTSEVQDTPSNGRQDAPNSFLEASLKDGVIRFVITSINVAVVKTVMDGAIGVTKELGGANVVEVTKVVCNTTVKLAGLYTGYKLLQPLIDVAIKKAFDEKSGDKKVEDIKPGSLHVALRCFTDESFLEVLTDYESGKIKERLQIELSKIGIEVKGLKIEIENRKEVERTYADIEEKRIEKSLEELETEIFEEEAKVKYSFLPQASVKVENSVDVGVRIAKTAEELAKINEETAKVKYSFLPQASVKVENSVDVGVRVGKEIVGKVLNSTAVELGFAIAEEATVLSNNAAEATTALTSPVAAETGNELSDAVVDITKSVASTAVTLAALYVSYKLLKPLIESAVREAFGDGGDDEEVSDIKPAE